MSALSVMVGPREVNTCSKMAVERGRHLIPEMNVSSPTPVPREERKGTVSSSVVNLLATTMGAGLLSLPNAFSCTGALVGIAALVLSAVAASYSLEILVACARFSGRHSFEGNAEFYLGKVGLRTLNSSLILLLFGATVAMYTIILDLAPAVLRRFAGCGVGECQLLEPIWIGLYAMALMFPLSVQDSITALRYTSFIGLICIFYFWGALACHFLTKPHIADGVAIVGPAIRWFQGIPVMFSAYLCQFNIFKIDRELKPEAKSKMGRVIRIAICGIATTAYVTGGMIGYCMFGAGVKNDVLEEFNNDASMAVARLMLACCNMFKIPLMIIPMRTSIAEALQWPEAARSSLVRRVSMCAAINAVVYTTAYNLESLSKALGLLGCTAGVVIAFVLPGLLRLKYLQQTGGRCIPLTAVDSCNMALGDFLMTGFSPRGVEGGSFISGVGEATEEQSRFQKISAYVAPYVLIIVASFAGVFSLIDILSHWQEQ